MRMYPIPNTRVNLSLDANLAIGNGATLSRSLLPIMTRFSESLSRKNCYDNSCGKQLSFLRLWPRTLAVSL